MRTFDRIVLMVLAAGIWALVLKPTVLPAHLSRNTKTDHTHKCTITGQAFGFVTAGRVYVDNFQGVFADCGAR